MSRFLWFTMYVHVHTVKYTYRTVSHALTYTERIGWVTSNFVWVS